MENMKKCIARKRKMSFEEGRGEVVSREREKEKDKERERGERRGEERRGEKEGRVFSTFVHN